MMEGFVYNCFEPRHALDHTDTKTEKTFAKFSFCENSKAEISGDPIRQELKRGSSVNWLQFSEPSCVCLVRGEAQANEKFFLFQYDIKISGDH